MKKSLLTTIDGITKEAKIPYIDYDLWMFLDIDRPVHIIMEKDQIVIKFLNTEKDEPK